MSNRPVEIFNLGEHNGFGIYGIKALVEDNYIKFRFWCRIGEHIKFTNVVFDEEQEKMSVERETAILSLKDIKTPIEIKKALIVFIKTMQANQFNNIKFFFFISNNQKDTVVAIGQELGLIQDINQQVRIINQNLKVVNTTTPQTKVYVEQNMILNLNNDPIGMIGQGFNRVGDTIYQNGTPVATVISPEVIEQENNDAKGVKNGKSRVLGSNINYIPTGNQVRAPINSGKGPTKSAAFVNLPIIMFILSALLLISSIILLFVLD